MGIKTQINIYEALEGCNFSEALTDIADRVNLFLPKGAFDSDKQIQICAVKDVLEAIIFSDSTLLLMDYYRAPRDRLALSMENAEIVAYKVEKLVFQSTKLSHLYIDLVDIDRFFVKGSEYEETYVSWKLYRHPALAIHPNNVDSEAFVFVEGDSAHEVDNLAVFLAELLADELLADECFLEKSK